MLKINVSQLRDKIGTLVEEYYKLKEKPELKEIPKERIWIRDMIYPYVSYAIINRELKDVASIQVSERTADDYTEDKSMPSCIKKKGYKIVKRLGEWSSKYVVEGNKTAKVKWISLWEYKQKDELKSIINNEFRICKKAEALGIGPKTHDTFICYNKEEDRAYKVIINDYIKGMSLKDWLEKDHSAQAKEHVHKLVKRKIDKMHEAGIIHNALWSSNVILKITKGKVVDAFITDFVHAYDVKDKTMWDYNKWIQEDRFVLDNIKNNTRSFSNADDVVSFVAQKLIDKKYVVIV